MMSGHRGIALCRWNNTAEARPLSELSSTCHRMLVVALVSMEVLKHYRMAVEESQLRSLLAAVKTSVVVVAPAVARRLVQEVLVLVVDIGSMDHLMGDGVRKADARLTDMVAAEHMSPA